MMQTEHDSPSKTDHSVLITAGGAFHGHTIEAWDYDRQVAALREEVHEAVDESRRAKLYCLQVRKDLTELINTELDGKQDSEMLGGISSILSNTNTLVEKFAVFELYLRDKISAEQQEREERLWERAQQFTTNLVDTLREDVRSTLKSFKKEIIALRDGQKEDLEASTTTFKDANRELDSRLASLNDQLLTMEAASSAKMGKLESDIHSLQRQTVDTAASLKSQMVTSVGELRTTIHDVTRHHEDQLAAQSEALTSFQSNVATQLHDLSVKSQHAVRDAHTQLVREVTENAGGLRKLQADSTSELERRLIAVEEKSRQHTDRVVTPIQQSLKNLSTSFEENLKSQSERFEQRLHALKNDAEVTKQSLHESTRMELSQAAVSHSLELRAMQERLDDVSRTALRDAERFQSIVNEQHERLQQVTNDLQDARSKLSAADSALVQKISHTSTDIHALQETFKMFLGEHRSTQTHLATMVNDCASHSTLQAILEAHKSNIINDVVTCHIPSVLTSVGTAVDATQRQLDGVVERVKNELVTAVQQVEVSCKRKLSHQAVQFLLQGSQRQLRIHTISTWRRFTSLKQAQRVRKVTLQRQWALGSIHRLIVPQMQSSLRRQYFALWKRYLTARRGTKRLHRVARTLAHDAQRRTMQQYLTVWRKFLTGVRRPRRMVTELLARSKSSLLRIRFTKWTRLATASLHKKTNRRYVSILSLGVAHGGEALASLPHHAPPAWRALSPLQRRWLIQFWRSWASSASRRCGKSLKQALGASDSIVEATRCDVHRLFAMVGDLEGGLARSASAMSRIVDMFAPPRLVRTDTEPPGAGLAYSIRELANGYASVHDVFSCLGAWVDLVERTQRSLIRDVANLQAWSSAVDEEIRRVQKFVRPPFK